MTPPAPESDDPVLREDVQFGEHVVAQGLCTREQVEECLELLRQLARRGQRPLPRLGGLLMQRGYIGQAESGRTVMIQATPSPSPPTRVEGAAPPPRVADPELPAEAVAALKDSRNLIGKYVKVRLLGVGGMGEVWKAWDRELMRWVALKFLKHDDPHELARFRIEAQAAAGLNHPNICAVHEVGKHEGRPFIAMQYLEGLTLQAYPRGDRRALVDIFRKVALAIHCAHEAGVVHRDLKPANIMVSGRGDVFVMDFGLAKAANIDSSISVSGAVVGTPSYMSPEQARGGKSLDGRADVYSLGATMYEVFGGEALFRGSAVYDILIRIAEEEPRSLRKKIPHFDRELDTIILKCLEKERFRRYASAAELAEDLRRWLDREPILAHPPSVFYRLRKRLAKKKAVVGLACLAVATAVTLSILVPKWTAASSEAAQRKEDAKIESEIRERERKAREEARTFLTAGNDVLQQIYRNMGDAAFDPKTLVENARRQFSRALEIHAALPEAYLGRARLALLTGDRGEARKEIDQAIQVGEYFAPAYLFRVRLDIDRYKQLRHLPSGGNRPESPEARKLRTEIESDLKRAESSFEEENPDRSYVRGLLAFSRSEYREAERQLGEFLKVKPADAAAHYWRGHSLYHLEDFREAETALSQCLRFDAHALAALKDRAAVRLALKNYKGAVTDFDRILKVQPNSVYALLARGEAKMGMKDVDGSIKDFTASISRSPSWEAFYARGRAYLENHDADTAVQDLTLAFAQNRKNPDVLRTLGYAHFLNKNVPLALKALDRSLEIDGSVSETWLTRSRVRLAQGDREGALKDLGTAISVDARNPGLYYERGELRIALRDPKGAKEDFTKSIELQSRNFRPWLRRGDLKAREGDLAGAEEDYTRALRIIPTGAEAMLGRALVRLRRGARAEAIADLEKGARHAPAGSPLRIQIDKVLAGLSANPNR